MYKKKMHTLLVSLLPKTAHALPYKLKNVEHSYS